MHAHAATEGFGTDLQLPEACFACGGPLWVRLSPAGAHGCCPRCRYLAALRLERDAGGLRVTQAAAAVA